MGPAAAFIGIHAVNHREQVMISRMHLVQNAARLGMADHRAATLRRPRRSAGTLLKTLGAWLAAVFAGSRPTAAD